MSLCWTARADTAHGARWLLPGRAGPKELSWSSSWTKAANNRSCKGMPASTSILGRAPISNLSRSTKRRLAGDNIRGACAALRLGVLLDGGRGRGRRVFVGERFCVSSWPGSETAGEVGGSAPSGNEGRMNAHRTTASQPWRKGVSKPQARTALSRRHRVDAM